MYEVETKKLIEYDGHDFYALKLTTWCYQREALKGVCVMTDL